MSMAEPPVTYHYTGEEVDGVEPPYDDVEVATVSSDILAIGSWAFKWCIWLRTITIPNNIQTIGVEAFCACKRLISISLPPSVTTIKRGTFSRCSNLTIINIPPSCSLTTIEEEAFSQCFKLTTISLPRSVTTIKKHAFSNCDDLTSVNIPPSSNLTTIGKRAFYYCKDLQMITLPKHTTVEECSFDDCSMLYRGNQSDTVTWLKRRFDDLPLHQLCHNINDTTTDISTMQINNQALTTQDALGMTPIHVLLSNPFATPDMIRQLVSNNRDAAQVRNIHSETPLSLYLKIKSPLSLLAHISEYDIHDMIDWGEQYELMDLVCALSGRRIEADLNHCNEATGFYPFMSAAISHEYKLVDVYKMAIANADNL